MPTFSIGGVEYSVERARLRKWLELEELRNQIQEAAERKHIGDIAQAIFQYVSAASDAPIDILPSASWLEVFYACHVAEYTNKIDKEFPIFKGSGKHDIMKDADWDYPGRSTYNVLHLLCAAYGWTLEYASNIRVEDGIALMQEVLVEKQLEREWEWGLSEMAYEYNPSSKTSRFRELPRPMWMRGVSKPLVKRVILRTMLPVGNVKDLAKVGLHGTEIDSIKH